MENEQLRTEFIVKEETQEFREKYECEESYVALQSSNIRAYVKASSPNAIFNGFVEVSNPNNKRKIIRRVISNNTRGLNGDCIIICYRSRKYLDVKEGDTIILKKAHWFRFLWNHVDSAIRYPFRIALVFGCLSIIGVLLTVYNLLCCQCC